MVKVYILKNQPTNNINRSIEIYWTSVARLPDAYKLCKCFQMHEWRIEQNINKSITTTLKWRKRILRCDLILRNNLFLFKKKYIFCILIGHWTPLNRSQNSIVFYTPSNVMGMHQEKGTHFSRLMTCCYSVVCSFLQAQVHWTELRVLYDHCEDGLLFFGIYPSE